MNLGVIIVGCIVVLVGCIVVVVVKEIGECYEHRRSRGCTCVLIWQHWYPFDCPIHAGKENSHAK